MILSLIWGLCPQLILFDSWLVEWILVTMLTWLKNRQYFFGFKFVQLSKSFCCLFLFVCLWFYNSLSCLINIRLILPLFNSRWIFSWSLVFFTLLTFNLSSTSLLICINLFILRFIHLLSIADIVSIISLMMVFRRVILDLIRNRLYRSNIITRLSIYCQILNMIRCKHR